MNAARTGLPSPSNKALVLAGPTGAGKSEFAIQIAERIGAEIVCADAFQIYRGMEILTAQPPRADQKSVPHHLYGFLEPSVACDAMQYAKFATSVMSDIRSRGKIPLLVGGSGMYLQAVFGGFDDLPPPDPALREELAGKSLSELQAILQEKDPEACAEIDLKNPRRVSRSLEIVIQTGRPLSASRTKATTNHESGWLVVRERQELESRIEKNVHGLFEKGVEKEVAALQREDVGPTASRAIGYREVCDLLAGKHDREQAIRAIHLATRRYAKRQLTWFRNRTSYQTVVLGSGKSLSESVEEALRALLPP